MLPLDLLRGLLGALCVFYSHMTGRSVAALRQGRQRPSRVYGWVLRTILCSAVLAWREVGGLAVAVWVLDLIAFGAGMWIIARARPEPDLVHEIFPE